MAAKGFKACLGALGGDDFFLVDVAAAEFTDATFDLGEGAFFAPLARLLADAIFGGDAFLPATSVELVAPGTFRARLLVAVDGRGFTGGILLDNLV